MQADAAAQHNLSILHQARVAEHNDLTPEGLERVRRADVAAYEAGVRAHAARNAACGAQQAYATAVNDGLPGQHALRHQQMVLEREADRQQQAAADAEQVLHDTVTQQRAAMQGQARSARGQPSAAAPPAAAAQLAPRHQQQAAGQAAHNAAEAAAAARVAEHRAAEAARQLLQEEQTEAANTAQQTAKKAAKKARQKQRKQVCRDRCPACLSCRLQREPAVLQAAMLAQSRTELHGAACSATGELCRPSTSDLGAQRSFHQGMQWHPASRLNIIWNAGTVCLLGFSYCWDVLFEASLTPAASAGAEHTSAACTSKPISSASRTSRDCSQLGSCAASQRGTPSY